MIAIALMSQFFEIYLPIGKKCDRFGIQFKIVTVLIVSVIISYKSAWCCCCCGCWSFAAEATLLCTHWMLLVCIILSITYAGNQCKRTWIKQRHHVKPWLRNIKRLSNKQANKRCGANSVTKRMPWKTQRDRWEKCEGGRQAASHWYALKWSDSVEGRKGKKSGAIHWAFKSTVNCSNKYWISAGRASPLCSHIT